MGTIIIALIMFLLLVTIHEFGHFIVAKLSNIKVNEFAVGMGPKIYGNQKGETLYTLRLLPIGGYCAMEGEEEGSSDPRSYDNAPAYKRFLTILAGPVMNLLLAVIVFGIVAFNTGVASNEIGGFADNSPAQAVGIEEGDEVLNVGLREIKDFSDIGPAIDEYYKEFPNNKDINVTVVRNMDLKLFTVVPDRSSGRPMLGISAKMRDIGFFESIGQGFKLTWENVKLIFSVFGNLFTGKIAFSALSGPVGVVKEIGNQAQSGIMNLLYFLAYISVNLAVFNLLPIPALDGSKLVTNLYEMITGKPVNKEIEQKVTVVGFLILLGLIVIVTIKDIFTLF